MLTPHETWCGYVLAYLSISLTLAEKVPFVKAHTRSHIIIHDLWLFISDEEGDM